MNPLHWLEQHPNAALVAVVGGSVLLLFFAAWIVHYYVRDVRYWLDWLPRRKNLPGPESLPAPRAGEPYADEWDADWQAEPWTDADADQLITDLRGEEARYSWCYSHSQSAPCPVCDERAVSPALVDVWDEWWAGLDGLDRELILVRHAREREERLWAELLAETREMCAA